MSCGKGSDLKLHTSQNTSEHEWTRMNTSEHEWNTSEREWNTSEHEWNTSEHEWNTRESTIYLEDDVLGLCARDCNWLNDAPIMLCTLRV
jgi:hypothetical protein